LYAPLDNRKSICSSGDIPVFFGHRGDEEQLSLDSEFYIVYLSCSKARIHFMDPLKAPLDDRPALCGSGDILVSLSTGAMRDN
jgi:hypothetical protein